MIFTKGENKIRPGVYLRFEDIGEKTGNGNTAPDIGDNELTVTYDASSKTLIIIGSGITVTYDGISTVSITGLESSVSYKDGTVTIGG